MKTELTPATLELEAKRIGRIAAEPKPKVKPHLNPYAPLRTGNWWCNAHQLPATLQMIDYQPPIPCCDHSKGNAMMMCSCVNLDFIATIEAEPMKWGLWHSADKRWVEGWVGGQLKFATRAEADKARSQICGRKRDATTRHLRFSIAARRLP